MKFAKFFVKMTACVMLITNITAKKYNVKCYFYKKLRFLFCLIS
ncbi:hypothetical protein appser11_1590 [Actinobacillus pleuropneumoniae serovar 11 str. 56153]|uniref:Uncharacterized protein n=1 Tax=Actinobacillus pleuropneumoniae serovar 6 str. Femo TaxID=754256 RepID=A0A828Q044_ACTPL|nr:hypothetical protein appser2_1220 [Actinobacillus pleuropneumoniae serovar 2 str. S1536]EFM90701.1 hypothetical protein appser4_1590 [Actinobacillus pleuropneumoniae serovar 4 str. M62]EFM92872.1 hypothetical protein appser6_1890 [Actinobacillus pleuropneumoniae serovar 6 str. Femo]EFM95048.1 hypothetical protein appser9_1600 [Actinobacillus pleuropneumoniae serovar 9 str. CVJ13261]EFM99387.1 hypothetical protein appser11_1590 [Actinobacillus pleuropneumoniae serovar 11 str. 56153]